MNFKKNILIVGGTGFIGYHLAKRCLKLNWNVTSISTKRPIHKRYLKNVNYIVSDITKKKKLNYLIKKNFNFVVNLGGYVDHINKKKTYNTHFLGLKNLVEIFIKKNITSFVQAGSSAEYGDTKSPHSESSNCNSKLIYGKSKLLASNYLMMMYKKYKFPVTVLRFYQVFGHKQDFNRFIPILIKACINNEKFPCSNGTQLRDFLYVDDAIDAILKSLKNIKAHGKIINIGMGRPIMLKKIIKFVRKKAKGGKPQFGKIKLRVDEPKVIFPKLSKAKKILNWKSKITFEKGLNKTLEQYE